MLKKDEKHEDFVSTVLCSKGIGSGYLKRADAKTNIFNGEKTKELYTTRTRLKLNLPKYYRNKIYSEEEREKLWIQKIEKGDIYVMGEKVNADDWKSYNARLRSIIFYCCLLFDVLALGGSSISRHHIELLKQNGIS